MGTGVVCKVTCPEASSIPLAVHTMRKMLMLMVVVEGKLDDVQKGELDVLLGEAITNAFVHASQGGEIVIEQAVSDHKIDLKIVNQCDGLPCRHCSGPEDLEEGGRGCKMIEDLAADLRSGGLAVNASYENLPGKGKPAEETVFLFSLSL